MVHKIIQQKLQANFYTLTILILESDKLLQYCLSLRNWGQRGFLIFGKNFELPRLIAGFDHCNEDYDCFGITCNKNALTQTFAKLLARIFSHPKINFNYLLLNIYRNRTKSIGCHSKKAITLGNKSIITMLSLGVRLIFKIKTFLSKEIISIKLKYKCTLLMKNSFQIN